MKKRTGSIIFIATMLAVVGGMVATNSNTKTEVEALTEVSIDTVSNESDYVTKITDIYNKLKTSFEEDDNYNLNTMYDLENMNGFAYKHNSIIEDSIYAMSYSANVYKDKLVDTSNYIEYVIDIDNIKDKSFRVENTVIKDITKLFTDEDIDYTEINNGIISAYNGEDFDVFIDEIIIGDFSQTILISKATDENDRPYYRLIVENVLTNK